MTIAAYLQVFTMKVKWAIPVLTIARKYAQNQVHRKWI